MMDVTYTGYGFDKNDILNNIADPNVKNILEYVFDNIQDYNDPECNVKLNDSKFYIAILQPCNTDEFELLFLIPDIPAVVMNPEKSQPVIDYKTGNKLLLKAICEYDDYTKSNITPEIKKVLKETIDKVATDEINYWDLV